MTDVKEAQEIFKEDQEAWKDNYDKAESDLCFLSPGGQWNDADRKAREFLSLPALEIDKISQYVHQVVNDARMNTPSINPMPVDDNGDVETAKILKGLIKHIEYSSNADISYDTGVEYGIKCGLGWLRVDHKYSSLTGFEQELVIDRVVDPLSILIDPNIVQPDGSDAMRGFALETISKRAFEATHPGESCISFGGDGKTTDVITLAEFFKIEETEKKSVLLDSGDTVEFQNGMKLGKDGVRLIRSLKNRKVYRCKMNGVDTLEETTFPGIYIPLVPVFGEEAWVKGKREIYSLIRRSKDAQRRYNHWASKEMEILQKAPIAPIAAAEGSFEDYASDYQNPSETQVMRYKAYDENGRAYPPPTRLNPAPVPPGIINAMAGANEDIKSTLGLYDASIGNRSNEVSGVAIENRQRKGDVATFHFGDNLVRSITHVGRILISAIPEIYDTPRILRIIGEEDEAQMVGVNGKVTEGQKQTWNLKDAGRYDIRVTTGPSYTTRRQETQALMSDLMAKQPELMKVIGDLMFKYSDMPGAQAVAARLKKTIPPQFLEDEEDKQDLAPQLLQAQQAIEQMKMLIQQSQVQLQEQQAELAQSKMELANKQGELALKAREGLAKAENDRVSNELKAEELRIKNRELDLKEKQIELDAFSAQIEAIKPPPQDDDNQTLNMGATDTAV